MTVSYCMFGLRRIGSKVPPKIVRNVTNGIILIINAVT